MWGNQVKRQNGVEHKFGFQIKQQRLNVRGVFIVPWNTLDKFKSEYRIITFGPVLMYANELSRRQRYHRYKRFRWI